MADYTKRYAQVLDYLTDFTSGSLADAGQQVQAETTGTAKTMIPSEASKTMDSFAQERVQFQSKASDYFNARNARLKELVEGMDLPASGDIDLAARWKNPLGALADSARTLLGALLSGIDKPTNRAAALKWKILSEEGLFVNQLAALPAVDRWTAMRDIYKALANQIENLRTRWNSILAKMAEINQAEMDLLARMESKLRAIQKYDGDLFHQVDTARWSLEHAKGTDLSQDKVSQDLSGAADSMENAGQAISNMTSAYNAAREELRGLLDTLDGLQGSEIEGPLRLFKDIRKEIADYVREPADKRAKALQDQAEKMLADWASGLGAWGPGMRADAEALAHDLSDKPNLLGLLIVQKYADFEKDNKGKFYDDLSSDRMADLLKPDSWANGSRWLLGADCVESPGTILRAIDFSVPLGEDYDALLAAIADRADKASADALSPLVALSRETLLKTYGERLEPLRAALQAMSDLLKSSDYSKHFERSRMADALRSS